MHNAVILSIVLFIMELIEGRDIFYTYFIQLNVVVLNNRVYIHFNTAFIFKHFCFVSKKNKLRSNKLQMLSSCAQYHVSLVQP